MLSLLDVVGICDNTRPRSRPLVKSEFDGENLIAFRLSPSPTSPALGLLRPVVVERLRDEAYFCFDLSSDKPFVSFSSSIDTISKRNEAMKELCERWRDQRTFDEVCGPSKWRSELYPVFKNPFGHRDHPTTSNKPEQDLNFAFEMERSACAVFGVVTYGVHMNIYALEGKDVKVWVPTRSKNKPTFPGLLDNSVAGGTPSGMGLFESLVKEAMEEASIAEDIVRKHTSTVGVITYFFRTSKGWLQPEVEYVYDLVIPSDDPFTPKPNDGEVEIFEVKLLAPQMTSKLISQFLDQNEIMSRMRNGRFKPNCALVLIDLFMRLGYITPESEENYLEIATRIHGNFEYLQW